MKEKLKTIWFIMVVISVLAQTALSFLLLYKKAPNTLIGDIIIILTLTYIFAFLLIVFLSAYAKKISREAMQGYKRSLKVVKRVLTLLMLVVSIVNFLSAGGSGVDFIFSIILVIFNLIVIYIDILVSRVKEKFDKKSRSRERIKKDEQVRAYRVGMGNLSKTKSREEK